MNIEDNGFYKYNADQNENGSPCGPVGSKLSFQDKKYSKTKHKPLGLKEGMVRFEFFKPTQVLGLLVILQHNSTYLWHKRKENIWRDMDPYIPEI